MENIMDQLITGAFIISVGLFLWGWFLLIMDEEVEHKRKKEDKEKNSLGKGR
jgi:high-affinity Fe2+/Pb2+ permease